MKSLFIHFEIFLLYNFLIAEYSAHVERISWILAFWGMLTQVCAEYAFPSYNVVLGFWGAYCSFSKHGRATFGWVSILRKWSNLLNRRYICFLLLASFLDIVFCSLYGTPKNNKIKNHIFCEGSDGKGSTFQFALTDRKSVV